MKARTLFSIALSVSFAISRRSVLSPEPPPLNISSLDTTSKDIYPANITIASGAEADQIVHVTAINNVDYHKSEGDLEKEMVSWGWDNWNKENPWCEFHEDGLISALKALGISDKSVESGGDNTCWTAFHFDSPGVIFDPNDPEYIDDEENEMLAKDNQYYMDPNNVKKRCTGGQYTFGVNNAAGTLFFVSRKAPLEAAKEYWKQTPPISDLPDLRASSDLAWGIWNKQRGPDHLGDIRKIFSLFITNKETKAILERARAKQGVDKVTRWPGTDIDAKSEEGLAILGSPNGRAGGYFLAQHKRQLGGNKYISKITIFDTDKEKAPLSVILFWIDDVPSPPPEMVEPDDEKIDTGTGQVESKVVRRRDRGRSLTRQHVVWV